jgi:hypothetical protein
MSSRGVTTNDKLNLIYNNLDVSTSEGVRLDQTIILSRSWRVNPSIPAAGVWYLYNMLPNQCYLVIFDIAGKVSSSAENPDDDEYPLKPDGP